MAQIDFDGDCLSDLFLTVQDGARTYYEIYLRREIEVAGEDDTLVTQDSDPIRGLNSLCLVAREEVPQSTGNAFGFADVDRDAMVDMVFVTKNDLSLNVYYNKLLNQQQIL